MNPVVAIVLVALVMSVVMTGLWLVQRRLLEADVVDLGWTAGLGGAAIFYAFTIPDGLAARRWLVAAMAAIWAGRLATYLLLKRVLVSGEDGRYKDLRAKWGLAAQGRFFVFFQFQGLLVALLSVHFLVAMLTPTAALRLWDGLGLLVWVISISGESLADRQLSRFREDPANSGRVCQVGLWRYSRHPNYFFEWLHWLAYIPIAIGSPLLPVMVLAPVLMLSVILFVTGIPPIERRAVASRGEEYRRYQRTTSAFFPWFPSEEA
jgi:steroid 5-alpha reductase family enzyme